MFLAFAIVGGADGRCISLLKILMSNACIYDCKYCINRCTNSVKRATFTPREIADLTIAFYKRNYIEGLFLSSAVIKNPDYTMELLYEAIFILRKKYNFNGYIHVKTIPGTSKELIDKLEKLTKEEEKEQSKKKLQNKNINDISNSVNVLNTVANEIQ